MLYRLELVGPNHTSHSPGQLIIDHSKIEAIMDLEAETIAYIYTANNTFTVAKNNSFQKLLRQLNGSI